MRVCACTIAAWPMLPSAAVVARSFTDQHPGVPFVTLVADTTSPGYGDVLPPVTGDLITIADLGRPDLVRRAFRAEQQPFSYALTAALLEHLLDQGHDAVLFFKQESLILAPHDTAIAQLETCDILLTPHLLEPTPGADAVDRERNILLSGVYNLGFLGVSSRPEARRFLRWWDERLDTHCRHAVASGMHYEQRWIDLVPSLFENVGVLRDPTYNVGHWNITERRVTATPDGTDVRTGGQPCRLIRFSGYDPADADHATRYTTRVAVRDLGSAVAVFARYRRELLAAGWEAARELPYGFDSFDDGLPVPALVRALHRALPQADAERFGDPFETGAGSFRDWLTEAVGDRRPAPSRLLMKLLEARSDLREAFADPLDADRTAFVAWARTARGELGLPVELDVAVPADRGPVAVAVTTSDRLPQARILAMSLRAHHPDVPMRVVILDRVPPHLERDTEPFVLLDLHELGIPELQTQRLTGRWMELAVRAKPAALEALLAVGHDVVLYLDVDIEVRGDLTPLLDAARAHPVVLLPHLLRAPAGDPAFGRELLMLRAGTFNGGVVTVRPSRDAARFLAWWSARLAEAGHNDADNGVYYDQRWLDLAPAMFDGIHVLRDARFDVAYWNLRERRDEDWRLVHYSGFDVARAETPTRHDPALRLDDLGPAREVFSAYAEAVRAAGHGDPGLGRPPDGTFADGVAIPEVVPAIAARLGRRLAGFGDPLGAGPGSFRAWLAAPADDGPPAISNLWLAVHGLREDLRRAYPDPLGADRGGFAMWCRVSGVHEHPVPPELAPG